MPLYLVVQEPKPQFRMGIRASIEVVEAKTRAARWCSPPPTPQRASAFWPNAQTSKEVRGE